MHPAPHTRRTFLKRSAALTTGVAGMPLLALSAAPQLKRTQDSFGVVGPREGFTPHVGTMYSMLHMMRHMILEPLQGLTVEQLDYLHDANANSIGALLWHMAATETYYQFNTFDGVKWGSWSDEVKKKWDVPMNLGPEARKQIKGNSLDFYLNILTETRQKTVEEFKKRDDGWLMIVDQEWGWNNYGKWFHVCEHESNHNGQIKWIKSRLPGAKAGND